MGGRLFATERGVLFQPTGLEQGLGQERWQCSSGNVLDVDLAERELNLFSGGLRRRVRIRTKTSTELFTVWRPRSVVHRLRQVVPKH